MIRVSHWRDALSVPVCGVRVAEGRLGGARGAVRHLEAITVILVNDLAVNEQKESVMADPTMAGLPAPHNPVAAEPDLLRELVERDLP